ncbi:MAG: hypothetical protein AVDCRST_MAG56-4198, partial [uncultured Cytophagales bacterium]
EILRCFCHCPAVALRSRAGPEIRRVRHQRGGHRGLRSGGVFYRKQARKGHGRADLQLAGGRLAFCQPATPGRLQGRPPEVRPAVRRVLRLRHFPGLQSPHRARCLDGGKQQALPQLQQESKRDLEQRPAGLHQKGRCQLAQSSQAGV